MERELTRRHLLQRAGTLGALAAVGGAVPAGLARAATTDQSIPASLTPARLGTMASLIAAVATANDLTTDATYVASALDGRRAGYELGSDAQKQAINSLLDDISSLTPATFAKAGRDGQIRAVRALRESLPADPEASLTAAQQRSGELWRAAVAFGSPPFDPRSESQAPPLHV